LPADNPIIQKTGQVLVRTLGAEKTGFQPETPRYVRRSEISFEDSSAFDLNNTEKMGYGICADRCHE
jgi:hypothetical protein